MAGKLCELIPFVNESVREFGCTECGRISFYSTRFVRYGDSQEVLTENAFGGRPDFDPDGG